ncbi:hypothetical protein BH09BAC5_BH09BAC5_04480 [soil metagenome]
MIPVTSTAEILMWKHLNLNVNERWKAWAYEMLETGFDSEHIIELAGIDYSENQFELQELTSKVFDELNLDYVDREKIILDFISFCVNQVLQDKRDLLSTIQDMKNIYNRLDQNWQLSDFALLYWAIEDLKYSEVQWYWPEADRKNINEIVKNYFKSWRDKELEDSSSA